MKVIDLLNKIANGEEVPKKIKIKDEIWIYDEIDYRASDDRGYLFEVHTRTNCQDLNEEVEILEEPNGIPKKLYHCCMETDNEETKFLIKNMNDLVDRYNELLDYLESKGE